MRLKEVIGKPIVSADAGEHVGRVEEVLLDGRWHHVVGVLVTDGLLSKQRVLPFEDVQTIGIDTVIVRTVTTMRDAQDWIQGGHAAHRSRSILGKEVVTADGARLGWLHDLVADEHTGDVVALEITTGKHGARQRRPTLVHAVHPFELTNDVVVIPPEVAATRNQ